MVREQYDSVKQSATQQSLDNVGLLYEKAAPTFLNPTYASFSFLALEDV
jgi:hypothetical protein